MNDFKFEPHPDMRVVTGKIGNENQPIILVENFINDAYKYVELTEKTATFSKTEDYYPGIRTQSPNTYMQLVRDVLGLLICKTFDLDPKKITHNRSFLSIVNTQPKDLIPFQRIPHFDGTQMKDIAFLHYLCDEKYGGTSFYRHNNTGFEYVDQTRLKKFIQTLDKEASLSNINAKYISDSTDLFTRIDSVEAQFNRLIIYRGTSLHSGDIREDYNFDTSPLTGRLTVTSFLYSSI